MINREGKSIIIWSGRWKKMKICGAEGPKGVREKMCDGYRGLGAPVSE